MIERLNKDPKVHGILVQLPLPKHIDESVITNSVATDKDVDGFDHYNVGQLSKRGGTPYFKPCTPNGIMELIKTTGIPLRGKTAVVIGRSDIVGTPVATMLRNEDCTVTVCHRYTQNLPEIVKQADIIVAAVGIAEYVKADWVKDGAIVIDVGINYKDDPTAKRGKTFGGDVDYEEVAKGFLYHTCPWRCGPNDSGNVMLQRIRCCINPRQESP